LKGDIDLSLQDSKGNLLASSTLSTGKESIQWVTISGNIYYIRIFLSSPPVPTGSPYNMTISALGNSNPNPQSTSRVRKGGGGTNSASNIPLSIING